MENVVKNDSVAANCFTPPCVKGADGETGSFNAAAGDLIDHSSDFEAAKALLEEGLAEEGMTVDDLEITILTDTGGHRRHAVRLLSGAVENEPRHRERERRPAGVPEPPRQNEQP